MIRILSIVAYYFSCLPFMVDGFFIGEKSLSRYNWAAVSTTKVQSTAQSNIGTHSDVPFIPVTGVTLKLAFDSQWAVADLSSEKSERFTCEESLDMVHRLRRCSDAVLVGRSTVEVDDCSLTVRRVPLIGTNKQPVRVVLDPLQKLKLENYKIANDGLDTILFHRDDKISEQKNVFSKFPNVAISKLCAPTTDGKLSAREITEILRSKYGINHLMVEGGPRTAMSFLEEGVVDRAIIVQAPLEFKEPLQSNMTASTFEESGLCLLGESKLGVDHVSYWSRPGLPWPADPLSSWP